MSAAAPARVLDQAAMLDVLVLDATERLRAPAAGERGLIVTIGPGVTVGLALLEW